ncbi:MAG: NAD(P)/FAD-dependent oxidoreductase [Pseudomonadota bacterium]
MAKRYDVVVLGVGNAGMGAAGVTRAGGLSVAMVDYQDPGGTCPLRGCVPKKVLVAAAQVLHQISLAEKHHIAVEAPKLDWPGLIARERTFVEGVPQMFADSLTGRGIDLYRARARFTGNHQVDVGGETLEASKIVIATGSKPRPLAIPGAEHMIVSDDILESPELPDSIVFVGGGVIALEFAHVYARAGSRVTILEALPRLLPRLDKDAVAQIHKESERIGIEVLTGVSVDSIAPTDGGLEVCFQHDGQSHTRRAAKVANGTGRIADLDGLDLAAGGIEHEGLRIAVDVHMASSSNPDVYVAGDALWSSPQLSPVASYEGRLVGDNILNGNARTPDYRPIPSAVYSVPALATVGLTEEEAREQGYDVEVKANDLTDWRSARTYAETAAYSKILIEAGSGAILGAHLVGHGAEESIHIFALAIKQGLTAADLGELVPAYPTFISDIKNMMA